MTNEAGKQLVRDYFEAFRTRDAEWWRRHIAPGFVRHDPGLSFEVRGPDGVAKLGAYLHDAFDEVRLPVEDLVADGDRVLARLRMTARHSGAFEGTRATGNRIDIAVMDLFRVDGDRLVEHWALMDNLSMLKQIGAFDA